MIVKPLSRQSKWALVGAGSAMLASAIVDRSLDAAWRAIRDEEPPLDPGLPEFTWPRALLWAAASGTAIAVAQLVARRGAVAGWKRVTGRKPPRRR